MPGRMPIMPGPGGPSGGPPMPVGDCHWFGGHKRGLSVRRVAVVLVVLPLLLLLLEYPPRPPTHCTHPWVAASCLEVPSWAACHLLVSVD